jgi:hypothetical protein
MGNQQPSAVIELKAVRPYYILSLLTAFFLLIAAGGSFVLRDIYVPFVPAHLIPEAYGQDMVSLVAVLVLILSLAAVRHNSIRGLVLLAGILLYTAYGYALYAFVALHNQLFLVYVALVGLPIYSLIGIMTYIHGDAFRNHLREHFPEKLISLYLMSAAVLITTTWIGFLLRTMLSKHSLPGINTVYVLDLSLLLPAFMIVAIQLWRQRTWAYFLSGVLLVKVVTLGLSIVVGKVFAYIQLGTYNVGLLTLFGILTITGVAALIVYLRNIREKA